MCVYLVVIVKGMLRSGRHPKDYLVNYVTMVIKTAVKLRTPVINETISSRKCYLRRNNNKVDSVETGFIVIAHLLS